MIARLQAPLSFINTRWSTRAALSRARFLHHQDRAVRHWMKQAVPKVQAFAKVPPRLKDLPVMDEAQLLACFADYNTHALSADQVRDAMTRDCTIGSLSVGASTGTSGNRGFFVISKTEKYRWLGSILAKIMADLLIKKQRVAVILPQGSGLYESANHVRQIRLQFFDLAQGPSEWRSRLEAFDPSVIIAPPKVLRHMVEQGFGLRPVRVFSAAETLDPVDRPVIEAGFGLPLGQIYMATEGLLGVTCRHGSLHLAEDSVHFEFEPVGEGLVTPLISSLRSDDGRLVAIGGRFQYGQTLTQPLLGYDTQRPRKEGLYRMITAMAQRDAVDRGLLFNMSAGAAGFKRTRCARPAIEYSAVYTRHLLSKRNTATKLLAGVLSGIGVLLLQKIKL